MLDPRSLVGLFWLAFVVLWLILAQFNKKASRGTSRGVAWALRVVILVAVLTVIPSRRQGLAALLTVGSRSMPLHPGIVWQWLGVGLCVLGFGFAFWARGYLGRNWGMPMSLRQGHELVTTGPYTYVRHPIYTGLMLAMIGSALVVGLWWLCCSCSISPTSSSARAPRKR